MWSTIGFSIYTFEGIGILMPCMQACDCPEQFDKILLLAYAAIVLMFIVYGELAYFAYGMNQTQQITGMLPQGDLIVKILITMNVLMLMLTYPLTIYPTNQILESLTWNKWLPRKGNLRTWSKNFSRFIICLSAAYLGIEL